jgi:hypothetical protein
MPKPVVGTAPLLHTFDWTSPGEYMHVRTAGRDREYPADENHLNTFDIDIIDEGGVLRFTLKGPGTYANLLRAAGTIIGETKSRAIWRVLCDATAMSDPVGAFEKFEAAVELARGADPRLKMAVVARIEAIDYIFENVARNRGVAVAVFRDEGAALEWLRSAKWDSGSWRTIR